MNFRTLFLAGLFTLLGLTLHAQQITAARFAVSPAGNITQVDLFIQDNVFTLSPDGSLSLKEHASSGLGYRHNDRDQVPSDFEIDFYGTFDREEKQGKVKRINGLTIDYFDVFDRQEKLGRVKSIGDIKIDYYDVFDREEKQGKLKSVGNIKIDYYDVFDRDEKLGKLKSAGAVRLDYFDQFSSSDKIGMLKSVKGNSKSVFVTIERDGAYRW